MNKKTKKILSLGIIFIAVSCVFFNPIFVGAGTGEVQNPATKSTSISFKIDNPFAADSIKGLIETIINKILVPVGGVIAVIMIMYAGFKYVTSKGDPGKIKEAREALTWAVIGAAILLGAWVISRAISTTISQLK